VRAPFDGSGTGIVPQNCQYRQCSGPYRLLREHCWAACRAMRPLRRAESGRSWSKRVDLAGGTEPTRSDAYGRQRHSGGHSRRGVLGQGDFEPGVRHGLAQRGKDLWAETTHTSTVREHVAVASATHRGSDRRGRRERSFTYTLERSTTAGCPGGTVVRDPENADSSTPGESYLGFVSANCWPRGSGLGTSSGRYRWWGALDG